MKFKCKESPAEYYDRIKAKYENMKARDVWTKWFAWYPVSVGYECYWLEHVERKPKIVFYEYNLPHDRDNGSFPNNYINYKTYEYRKPK